MAEEYLLGTRERLNVLRQKVDRATSGELIALVAGAPLRVYALTLSVATTTTVKFQSGSTDLTGAMTLNAGVPLVLPFNRMGWLETASGEALNVALGAGVQVSGTITYAPRA